MLIRTKYEIGACLNDERFTKSSNNGVLGVILPPDPHNFSFEDIFPFYFDDPRLQILLSLPLALQEFSQRINLI